MSIQTELTRITNAKAAIKTAIEGKGVTVPASTLLDGMAALIESIEAGGASNIVSGTFTPTGVGKFEIEHNLGLPPNIWCIYATGTVYTEYSLGLMFEYLPSGYDPTSSTMQRAIAVAISADKNTPLVSYNTKVNGVAVYKSDHTSSNSLISRINTPLYLPVNKKYLGAYVGTPARDACYMTVGVTYHWIVGVI